MLEIYPDEVKLIFKDYPLRSHRFAGKAAIAAHAADGQGKFWEFHDRLFKNSDQLSDEKIQEIARALDLDMELFEKDTQDPQIAKKIRQDMLEGSSFGVRAVPTVFINGRQLRNRTLESFQAGIEKELKKAGEEQRKEQGLKTEGGE